MVVFQALTWETRDTDDEHLISIFGKTSEGKSVCVTTAFTPYFFVKLPRNITQQKVQIIYNKIEKACPGCLTSYNTIHRKDVWGFQNNEQFPYLQLFFRNLASRRMVAGRLRRPLPDESIRIKMYESNLDPVLRLMHRTGIQSTGWLDTGDLCTAAYNAHVDIDLECKNWRELKPVENPKTAPFVVASVDIECNSSTGKFPDADIQGDACFQIAISLCKFGSDEPYDKTCLCYKKTDPELEGSTILSYDTEREMLMAFREYLHDKDVDIITGWNIFGFDLEYLMKRAIVTRCDLKFFQLSKLRGHNCELTLKKLSSSALGDNDLKLLPIPVRFIYDLFH